MNGIDTILIYKQLTRDGHLRSTVVKTTVVQKVYNFVKKKTLAQVLSPVLQSTTERLLMC